MLGEVQAAQRAKLGRGPEVDVLLAAGIAEYQVAVHIHQAGHQHLGAGVQHHIAGARRRRLGARTDKTETAVIDDHGLVEAVRMVQAGEQALAMDELAWHRPMLGRTWPHANWFVSMV